MIMLASPITMAGATTSQAGADVTWFADANPTSCTCNLNGDTSLPISCCIIRATMRGGYYDTLNCEECHNGSENLIGLVESLNFLASVRTLALC